METMILKFVEANYKTLSIEQRYELVDIAGWAGECDGHFERYSRALDAAMAALKLHAPDCEEYKELVAYFDGY